jgi:hypothetical protein
VCAAEFSFLDEAELERELHMLAVRQPAQAPSLIQIDRVLLGVLVLTNAILEAKCEKSTLLVLRGAVNVDTSILDVSQPLFVAVRSKTASFR